VCALSLLDHLHSLATLKNRHQAIGIPSRNASSLHNISKYWTFPNCNGLFVLATSFRYNRSSNECATTVGNTRQGCTVSQITISQPGKSKRNTSPVCSLCHLQHSARIETTPLRIVHSHPSGLLEDGLTLGRRGGSGS